MQGVNINAKDKDDYTPLILVSDVSSITFSSSLSLRRLEPIPVDNMVTVVKASLCGHFETVQLLLEAGALCERDTFQGERCCSFNRAPDETNN